MIVTFMEEGKKLDIMVKSEQKIEAVFKVLLENDIFSGSVNKQYRNQEAQLCVYSMRRSAYVNPMLTFCQGEIYSGDILDIRFVGN